MYECAAHAWLWLFVQSHFCFSWLTIIILTYTADRHHAHSFWVAPLHLLFCCNIFIVTVHTYLVYCFLGTLCFGWLSICALVSCTQTTVGVRKVLLSIFATRWNIPFGEKRCSVLPRLCIFAARTTKEQNIMCAWVLIQVCYTLTVSEEHKSNAMLHICISWGWNPEILSSTNLCGVSTPTNKKIIRGKHSVSSLSYFLTVPPRKFELESREGIKGMTMLNISCFLPGNFLRLERYPIFPQKYEQLWDWLLGSCVSLSFFTSLL